MPAEAKNQNANPTTGGTEIRSPIVVVVGHVDHGKTSLLDYIRKTNVTAKEAGGITQATGAYEVTHGSKKITFIDTPGHEAFSKMRSRGAKAADLAILVVAADDGVKPQTKESIQILKETKTPFVVAINKIDKNNADPERVKSDLAQNEVFLEGYGGDVSFQLISAKTGEGINDLLDLLLLAAELQELKFDSKAPGSGFVIEAKLDKRHGNEVAVVVKDGVLRRGDTVHTPSAKGKVKSLQNFLRENVNELAPSSPAVILGFETLPAVGEEFLVGEATAQNLESRNQNLEVKQKEKKEKVEGILSLTLILKADTAGSLEAISPILRALKDEGVDIEIFSEKVGMISDGDVKEAISARALIIGFNVKPEKAAESLADNNGIKIITSNIIYDLIEKVRLELTNIKTPKPLGIFEVLAIFNQKGRTQLIGGKVLEGEFKNKAYCDVLREDPSAGSPRQSSGQAGQATSAGSAGSPQASSGQAKIIGTGRIMSLKIQKQDVGRVEAGKECGVMFDSGVTIQVGDKIVIPPNK